MVTSVFGNSPSMGVKCTWVDFDNVIPFSPLIGTSFKVAALAESSIYLSNPESIFAVILVNVI
jgi:hypothetical protein